MKNIIRICNLMGRFSKFIFIIKIYEEFVEFLDSLFVSLKNYLYR